jgi:glutathione S-transferase
MKHHDEFIEIMEGYFGQYTKIQREIVRARIEGVGEQDLQLCASYLIDTFSTQYRIPPAVKEINEALESAKADRFEKEVLSLPDPMMQRAKAVEDRFAKIRREIDEENRPQYTVNGEVYSYADIYFRCLHARFTGEDVQPFLDKLNEIEDAKNAQ